MKRMLCFVMVAILCFSITGCGGKKKLVVSDEYTQFTTEDKEYLVSSVNKMIEYNKFINNKEYKDMTSKEIAENAVKMVVDIGVRNVNDKDRIDTFMLINYSSILLSGMQNDTSGDYVDKLNENFENLSKLFTDNEYAYKLMKVDKDNYNEYIESIN